MTSRILTIAATVGALSAFSLFSYAADEGPHDDAIKARQGLMQLYSQNLGILSNMAKEKAPYDAEIAAEAANNLTALATLGQSQLWPQGSDSETEGNAQNRAAVEIWETYPAIAEKGEKFDEAVAMLMPAAGESLDALQGVVGDVGGSCKGCHDDFRVKKD
ncbi:c-type cytochrome [Granulosicoccus antarcticus]|uniref:Cytochrome c-554 n=1 Tax=Granulosicoccus antarcticus IMCC3135 TaxID=1192854 RepID=A0A2Z2NQB5_9GAMM|nr:cytochrome c [Granulosicoccus antarcticus]ASJ72665.1 Cytochrome c-554 [Granulosicoccus antarcticus IMCC3135]